MSKVNQVLAEEMDSKEHFIRNDPEGKKLPQYYFVVKKELVSENNTCKRCLTRQNSKVETISGGYFSI